MDSFIDWSNSVLPDSKYFNPIDYFMAHIVVALRRGGSDKCRVTLPDDIL